MNSDNNPLGKEPVFKLMIKFAVPSIVAMLVSSIYNIVDQLFIGNKLGTDGNTATNVVFPIVIVCTALALLFGIGGASCFNLALGRGQKDKAPYIMGNALLMLIISGVLLSTVTIIFTEPLLKLLGTPDNVHDYAKDYIRVCAIGFPFLLLTTGGGHLIRADGSPKMTMICNLSGAIINVVLDKIFIFDFNWGMKGAAFATIIGQIISGVIVLVYMTRCKTVKLKPKHFVLKIRRVLEIAVVGLASFINQVAMMVIQIVMNNLLKHYGGMSVYGSSIPIACSGITMKISQLFFSIVIGISQGTQPIESYNYGAGNYDRVKKALKLAIFAAGSVSVLSFTLFQLFPRQLLALFGEGTEEYFRFGEKFLRIFIFCTFINFLQPVISTFFTSIGKSVKGVILSLTRQIIFLLPLMIILSSAFGVEGVTYSGPIADTAAAFTAIIMLLYELKRMKNKEKTVI